MAKTKISEFDSTPANNTDIDSINIAEGCAPSGINNAIRELMSQLKDQQTGASGDNFTVGGNLAVTGTSTFTGVPSAPTASAGTNTTQLATTAFVRSIIPAGVIMLWSGSTASIPTGWVICDGANSTPDLRNRFVVGAGSTYAVAGTGGSANAIVVSHTHTGTSTVTDPGHTHTQTVGYFTDGGGDPGYNAANPLQTISNLINSATTGITVATSISTVGDSATNANLPPYYALAYIMKT